MDAPLQIYAQTKLWRAQVRSSLAGIPSIVQWGASTDSADNTAAIQRALDALPATGGVLYVPPGIFKTGPVTVSGKSDFTIFGLGRETSVLSLIATGTLLTVSGGNFSTIQDLGFKLDGTPQGIAATSGLELNAGINNMTVSRCNFIGFATDGAYDHGTSGGGNELSGNKWLEGYHLGNGRHGLHRQWSHDFYVDKNQFGTLAGVTPGTAGCFMSNCNAGNHTANYHWSNTRGLHVESCVYNRYANNRLEINLQEGLYVDTANYCTFIGNTIYSNSQSGNGSYNNVTFTSSGAFGTLQVEFHSNNIFTWDGTNSAWGVWFNPAVVHNQLSVKGNKVDPTSFDAGKGPFLIPADAMNNGVMVDVAMDFTANTLLVGGTTYYVGFGSNATEVFAQLMAAARYAVVGYFVGLSAAPGVGQTITTTLRDNLAATGNTVTISGAATTGTSSVTTPQVLVALKDSLSLEAVASALAANTSVRGYILLVEY